MSSAFERAQFLIMSGILFIRRADIDEEAVIAVKVCIAERFAVDRDQALVLLAGRFGDQLFGPGAEIRDLLRRGNRHLVTAFEAGEPQRKALEIAGSYLAARLEEAIAAGVLRDAGPRMAFRHPLIRQALYEGTPAALRTALHQQAAQALAASGAPVDHVAEQLLAASGDVGPWVVDWLVDRFSRLVPGLPVTASVDAGGGQFLVVLTTGRR